jgi:2,4-dienoyl-CoA reductase (NADPH2)
MTVEQARWPLLWSSWQIGRAQARNRVVLAPMTVAYSTLSGAVTAAEIEHYERRAAGGAAVLITGHFAIDVSGRQLPHQTLVTGEHADGLRQLAAAVHRHRSLAVAQIGHAGRYAGPWSEYEKARRLAPSAVPFTLTKDCVVVPQEITMAEIGGVLTSFADAAEILVDAGFDGVQIHGSQGFLPSQFLSPRMNHRGDRYGGSFANRIRFSTDAVSSVRDRIGPRPILGFQLLADEVAEGGWTLGDAVRLAPLLEAAGVDFLMPTVTTFETVAAVTQHGEAARWRLQRNATKAIKDAVTLPVIVNGGITDPATAESLIRDSVGDAVGLGRPLLADPDWVTKVSRGDADQIRTCPCSPPMCLRTQLTGAVCQSWPAAAQALGYLGLADTDDAPAERTATMHQ